MLREAQAAARSRGIENVDWIRGGSTDLAELEPILGRFDLVTNGVSLHGA
jgi:hypothetical protein